MSKRPVDVRVGTRRMTRERLEEYRLGLTPWSNDGDRCKTVTEFRRHIHALDTEILSLQSHAEFWHDQEDLYQEGHTKMTEALAEVESLREKVEELQALPYTEIARKRDQKIKRLQTENKQILAKIEELKPRHDLIVEIETMRAENKRLEGEVLNKFYGSAQIAYDAVEQAVADSAKQGYERGTYDAAKIVDNFCTEFWVGGKLLAGNIANAIRTAAKEHNDD